MKYRGRSVFLILTYCAFASSHSLATTFIPKNETDMIKEATAICAVEVLDLKSEMIDSNVITKAKVLPVECFKGDVSLAKPFTVKWPGGSIQKGDKTYHSVVPGTPNLPKNKPALLYLWRSSANDDFTVFSWMNGVVRLERLPTNELVIPRGKSEFVPVPTNKSSKVDASKSKALTTAKPSFDSLSNFRDKVQKVLNAPASKK